MKFVIFFLLTFVCGSPLFCQEKQAPLDELEPRFISREPTCHMNSDLLYEVGMSSQPKDLIIIISHLGRTENKKFADRRLHNARTYLIKQTGKGNAPERVIISKGEESADQGYLDFFVKGRLELRLYIPNNKDFWVQPCVQDPDKKPCSEFDAMLYYPCKAK